MEGEKDAGTRLVKGQMTAKVLSVTDGGAGCSSLIFGRRDLNGGVTWLANDGGPLGLLGEKRARREEGQVLEARAARDMRMPGAGVAERGGLLPPRCTTGPPNLVQVVVDNSVQAPMFFVTSRCWLGPGIGPLLRLPGRDMVDSDPG